MRNIINLTPHTIMIEKDGVTYGIPPEGEPLRVSAKVIQVAKTPEGVPINMVAPTQADIEAAVERVSKYIRTPGHPEVGENIVVISGMALDWIADSLMDNERLQVLAPDTGPHSVIRDEEGKIAAVTALRVGRSIA